MRADVKTFTRTLVIVSVWIPIQIGRLDSLRLSSLIALRCSHGSRGGPLLLLLLGQEKIIDGFDDMTRVVLFEQHFFLPNAEQFAGPQPVIFILGLPDAPLFRTQIILVSQLININSLHGVLIRMVIVHVLCELDRCTAFYHPVLLVQLLNLSTSLAQVYIIDFFGESET